MQVIRRIQIPKNLQNIILLNILKNIPEALRKDVVVRADSAFCSEDFIRICLLMTVKFTITAHGNIGWEDEVRKLQNFKSFYTAA